jgi:hypothetical protein
VPASNIRQEMALRMMLDAPWNEDFGEILPLRLPPPALFEQIIERIKYSSPSPVYTYR